MRKSASVGASYRLEMVFVAVSNFRYAESTTYALAVINLREIFTLLYETRKLLQATFEIVGDHEKM